MVVLPRTTWPKMGEGAPGVICSWQNPADAKVDSARTIAGTIFALTFHLPDFNFAPNGGFDLEKPRAAAVPAVRPSIYSKTSTASVKRNPDGSSGPGWR